MSRQVGSALGVEVLAAVLGAQHARAPDTFRRAWILVLAAAVITGLAGLASGEPKAASQQIDATQPVAQRAGAAAK